MRGASVWNVAYDLCLGAAGSATSPSLEACESQSTNWTWDESTGQLVTQGLCLGREAEVNGTAGIDASMQFTPVSPSSSKGVSLGPLYMGGDLTLAAWVYDEDTSASWGRIVDLGNGAPGDNILLCHDGTAKRITYVEI